MLVTLICLTISTPTEAELELTKVPVSVPNLMTAPKIGQLHPDLPESLRAPEKGYFAGVDGDRYQGTFLPYPLDLAVLRRMRMLDNLPEIFQTQIDGIVQLVKAEADGRVLLTEQKCIAQQIRTEPVVVEGWSTLEVVIVTALGVAAGFGVYAIGNAAAKK